MMEALGFAIGAVLAILLIELVKTLVVVGWRRKEERNYQRIRDERVAEAMSKPAKTSNDPLYSPGLRGDDSTDSKQTGLSRGVGVDSL